MEFLVEFEVIVPEGTSAAEVERRERSEASAAAELVAAGHLIRVWKRRDATILGLYRAENQHALDALLTALPLADWMHISVTALLPHPNDPAAGPAPAAGPVPAAPGRLPDPQLTLAYRLDATVGPPLELGEIPPGGRRRIIALTGGTFTGPDLKGTLLPGASADWQTVLPDGTALGDIRYTLQTDDGDLLAVQSRSIRHGRPEVLARLAAGEDVDPHEYVFRASTQIQTAAPALAWLNQGVFVTVGARQPAGVSYATYLVD